MLYKNRTKHYKKHYNKRQWRRLRLEMWLEADKRCALCKKVTFDFALDHLERVPWDYVEDFDFFDKDNLQVLCVNCHNQKTRKEQALYNQPVTTKRPAKKGGLNEQTRID